MVRRLEIGQKTAFWEITLVCQVLVLGGSGMKLPGTR